MNKNFHVCTKGQNYSKDIYKMRERFHLSLDLILKFLSKKAN